MVGPRPGGSTFRKIAFTTLGIPGGECPGRGLLTGNAADFGTFDVPQLPGIARTAPYFHNSSAATLEEVLDHYDAFFRFVSATVPTAPMLTTDGVHIDRPPKPEERAALLAYLRKLQ